MLPAIVAALVTGLAAAGLPGPTIVDIDTTTGGPVWETGLATVTWTKPASWTPAFYIAQFAPLDHVNDFSSPAALADWVVSPGFAAHNVTLDAVRQCALVSYTGMATQSAAMGRGYSPYVFRRIPLSAKTSFQVTVADCADHPVDASWHGCLLVGYNSGFNKPLLTWGLGYDAATNSTAIVYSAASGNASFPLADDGSPWPLAGVQLRMELNTGNAARPYTLLARANDTIPWANATTRLQPVAAAEFDPGYHAGDIWWGFGAMATNGTAGTNATACFDDVRLAVPVPATPPTSVYGTTDVCIASPAIAAVNVTVWNATSARVRGLSSNFPYTITVWAGNGTVAGGNLSDPSDPIEGTYFWARRMPPRQQRLALWLHSKWLPAGATSTWVDASGNGHTFTQTVSTSLQPTSYRSGGCSGQCGGDYITPGYVRFNRAYANYMVTGGDAIDFGVTGPMTVYFLGRNNRNFQQVFLGKGWASNFWDNSPNGWLLGQYGTATEVAQGTTYWGMRVTGNNASSVAFTGQAAASTSQVTTSGYQSTNLMHAQITPGDSASLAAFNTSRYMPRALPPTPFGRFNVTACYETTCNAGIRQGRFDLITNYSSASITYPAVVDYQPSTTPGADPLAMDPVGGTLGPQHFLHLGGPSIPASGEPAYAWDGNVYDVMIYREVHTKATKDAILSWATRTYSDDPLSYCPRDLRSPTASSVYNCVSGNAAQYCYQSCSSGSMMLGYYYNYCTNGAWDSPSMVCKRRCPDIAPSLYLKACNRRLLNETFNATINPDAYNMLYMYPTYPEHVRMRTWTWQQALGYINGSTRTIDPCNRISNGASHLAINPYRWNGYFSYSQAQVLNIDVTLTDANSTAGITARLSDHNNHYRAEISTTGGLRFVRAYGNMVGTVIGSATNISFVPGVPYTVSIYSKARFFTVAVNNVTYITVSEPSYYNTNGGIGFYLGPGSAATFDNMVFEAECETSLTARYMFQGSQALLTCKPNFYIIGNTTLTCLPNGQWDSSLVCLSQPPRPVIETVEIPEFSKNGSFVTQATAYPANSEQTITYSIAAQWPPASRFNNTPTFMIYSCNGAIRVADPGPLDFWENPLWNITVFAWPDSQTIAGVYWNVTVVLKNVPTPPELLDATFYVNATHTGLFPTPWVYTNRNRYPLKWTILAGNSPPLFDLGQQGNMSVLAPGITWSSAVHTYTLIVKLEADSVYAEIDLSSIAIITIEVVDVNVPPRWITPPALVVDESLFMVPGSAVGRIYAADPNLDNVDAPVQWTNVSYALLENANFRGVDGIFDVLPDGSVVVVNPCVFDPLVDFSWYNRQKVRAVFTTRVRACDDGMPPLCSNTTATIAIVAANSSALLPLVDTVMLPDGGTSLRSTGGEIITIVGTDFPAGGALYLDYGKPALGASFIAANCVISSSSLASCLTVPGYGDGLVVRIAMDGTVVNATSPVVFSYLPPFITSVALPASFTTAGGAALAVVIDGENLYGPVSMALGPHREWRMVLQEGNATTFSTNHSRIVASMPAGCGANLPLNVIVGGQLATCAPSAGCNVSYPLPTITSLASQGGSFNVTSLSTLGGQRVIITGGSLGPAHTDFTATTGLVVTASYRDATGVYSYTVQCTKTLAAPHTTAECVTAPGVGAHLVFSVDVCGQRSAEVALSQASYAPPQLFDVTGPGASRASTEGGQLVQLSVADVGPRNAVDSVPQAVVAVRYGTPGVFQYTARSCFVSFASLTGSEITCLTNAGTGAGHYWYISVGFQQSAVLPKNTSYAQPALFFFDGPGADGANTEAGPLMPVRLNGVNLGDDPSKITVAYSTALSVERESDSTLPSSPGYTGGTLFYRPVSCSFVTPHRVLECIMPPSGSKQLKWSLVVDGLESTSPVTNFGPPVITAAWLNASAGALGPLLSTDGQDEVILDGFNFALDYLIQSVHYGPGTGNEFRVQSWRYASHRRLAVTTRPGIGFNLKFVVQTADQQSLTFQSSLSFATPAITGISTRTIPTVTDVGRLTLVDIRGIDMGLLCADCVVEILFGGGASDTPVQRLPVLGRSPTAAQAASPTFDPGPRPVLQTISFAAPAGVGVMRPVRVLQYLRGSQVREDDVAGVPLQGAEAFLSYEDPRIDYIIVYAASPYEIAQVVPTLFPDATPHEIQNAKRLDVVGANFGPSALTTGDSVGRVLEISGDFSNGTWVRGLAAFQPVNYTSYRITCFVLPPVATLRVVITSLSFNGSTAFEQLSNAYAYSDISPAVQGLVGTPVGGYPTVGGPGNVVTVQASGLSSTVQLNITIGVAPNLVNCKLLSLDGTRYINNGAEAVAMLAAQSGGLLKGSTVYSIKAEVPPGEGQNVPVLVWRNGAPSAALDGGATNLLSYAKPSVTDAGINDTAIGDYVVRPISPAMDLRVPTDGKSSTVTIFGSNFGICPSITLLHRADSAPVTIEACLQTRVNGTVTSVLNPMVRATHSSFEFVMPAGEGTGARASLLGWNLLLTQASGLHAQDADVRVPIRYQVPVVTGLTTPSPIDTSGHKVLWITGRNFGFLTEPVVRLLGGLGEPVPCTNVRRYSHSNMSVVVGAGSGQRLVVEVTVDDNTGRGGLFNYTPPLFTRMTRIPFHQLTANVTDALRNGSLPIVPAADAIVPDSAGASVGPQLEGSMHGGDAVVVDGFSLGSWNPRTACAFFAVLDAWSAAPSVGKADGAACDSAETFLGEGEVFANTSVLYWNHSRIAVRVPPGVSSRMLTVLVGGQQPAVVQLYANWRYAAPVVVPPLLPRSGRISTDGGDLLDITGSFAPRTVNSVGNESERVLQLPLPLPYADGMMLPTAQVRLDFVSSSSGAAAAIPCLGAAYGTNGLVAAGFSRCRMPSIASIALDSSGGGPADRLTMVVPPGVGANKSIAVTYVDPSGMVLVQTATVNFSYDKPYVRQILPDLALSLDASVPIYIVGDNFGRLRDLLLIDPADQPISVTFGDRECIDASRVIKNQVDQVQCRLPPFMPVGFANVTIVVAGQAGFLPETASQAMLVGCPHGSFGHFSEDCRPCPVGANCVGFLQDESIGVIGSEGLQPMLGLYSAYNVTDGPVMVGNVQVGRRGIHTYPVPLKAFFDLNGTMSPACPDKVRAAFPGRDVCIVGCVPQEACIGANLCSDAYTSKAPYFRCADCAKGFYRSSGDCIPCPQAPIMVFVGFAALILAVSGLGYMLHKHEIDVRIFTIGVDFFQVLAALFQSKVTWPPEVKQLARLLSAFNLNIEVLAPECLVPDFSFYQKFGAVLSLPFAVFAVFLVFNGCRYVVVRFFFKQRGFKRHLHNMAGSISVALLLVFLFYLNETKLVFSIWDCRPAEPDDGRRYLQTGAFEACGVPGGVQLTLIPWAVVGVVFIVVGYPVAVGAALFKWRALVAEDQVLRAAKLAPKDGTPVALLRAALSRSYYAFRPEVASYWLVVSVIPRKFGIALSSLIFSQNSSFQLAMCLLVLFLAFAAHMRVLPFMGADDYDAVLASVMERAKTDVFYQQLRLRALQVAQGRRKSASSNNLNARLDSVLSVGQFVGRKLLNYNVVEGVLLFAAALVCILGLLLQVAQPSDSYYESSRKNITWNLLVVLSVALAYFVVVVVVDIMSQYSHKQLITDATKRPQSIDRKAARLGGGGGSKRRTGLSLLKDETAEDLHVTTSTNPMHVAGSGGASTSVSEAVASMVSPPDAAAWTLVRQAHMELAKQVQALNADLADHKATIMNLQQQLEVTSGAGARTSRRTGDAATRREFAPHSAKALPTGDATSRSTPKLSLGGSSRSTGGVSTSRLAVGSSPRLGPTKERSGWMPTTTPNTLAFSTRQLATMASTAGAGSVADPPPPPPPPGAFQSNPMRAAAPPPPPPPPPTHAAPESLVSRFHWRKFKFGVLSRDEERLAATSDALHKLDHNPLVIRLKEEAAAKSTGDASAADDSDDGFADGWDDGDESPTRPAVATAAAPSSSAVASGARDDAFNDGVDDQASDFEDGWDDESPTPPPAAKPPAAKPAPKTAADDHDDDEEWDE